MPTNSLQTTYHLHDHRLNQLNAHRPSLNRVRNRMSCEHGYISSLLFHVEETTIITHHETVHTGTCS